MSLLSTVQGALGYENLGGGYRQPTSSITSIPSRDGGVRQPLALPNGAVPGVTGALRTSTARPGKMTNQRIVYARVQTQFPKECGHIERIPCMEGDVVFVHRMDGMNTASQPMGNDTARASRIASLTQLNEMLKRGNANTTGEITMAPNEDPRGLTPPADSQNPVWDRWVNCKALGRWTPDGVLASKEHDCVMDNSNPGEAFNVTVGGPTLTRNSDRGDYPQHFDDGVRVLDKLFVGLIAKENRAGEDGRGANQFFSFEYKLFTSRQLAWAPLALQTIQLRDMERNAPGGNNKLGPTVDEFARMVQVWRIGSILDNKAGMMPYRCATVNVVLEEWSLDMIQMEYNPYFGESFALAPIDALTVLEVLDRAKTFIAVEGDSIATGYEVLAPLYDPSFTSEVAVWEQLDAAYRDNRELADLRGLKKEDYPPPKLGSSYSQHGPDRLSAQTYYMDASPALKAFYEKFRSPMDWCFACRLLFTTEIKKLATVGRAASLGGNSTTLKWLEKQGRADEVVAAVKLHAVIVAMRPIMRMGERIMSGKAQPATSGGKWPL